MVRQSDEEARLPKLGRNDPAMRASRAAISATFVGDGDGGSAMLAGSFGGAAAGGQTTGLGAALLRDPTAAAFRGPDRCILSRN